jgi:phosphoribosyl 1,2-cyclic phosphodiesterase
VTARICVLASSSAGNSTFIQAGRTRLLVDAGLNRKATFERMALIGEDPYALDAILVTHEHSDHVAGLPLIAKSVKAPVFMSRLTAEMIDWGGPPPAVSAFQAGTSFEIGDALVQSFTLPHDAVDPVGYTVTCGALKIAIATDLGYMPESVKYHLRGSQFILLESNHCPEMLRVGPYPWVLKQRILSRKGHLSNEAAGEYIASHLPDESRLLVLGHLSEQNNSVWTAELTAKQALERRGLSPSLLVAEPRVQTELFHL